MLITITVRVVSVPVIAQLILQSYVNVGTIRASFASQTKKLFQIAFTPWAYGARLALSRSAA